MLVIDDNLLYQCLLNLTFTAYCFLVCLFQQVSVTGLEEEVLHDTEEALSLIQRGDGKMIFSLTPVVMY